MNRKKYIIRAIIVLLLASLIFVFRCSPGYNVRFGRVFYQYISEGRGFERIDMNADAKTFKIDEDCPQYGMDQYKAYYFGEPIYGSDGKTFQILTGAYQKDKNHVYYQNHIIRSADPSTFISPLIDSISHEPISFAKDKNDVYYCGKPLYVINRDSFTEYVVQGNVWGIDSEYCYCRDKQCRIQDYPSFQILRDGLYAKDSICVYYEAEVVEGADPSTFQVTTIFQAKDKNHHYDMGKIVDEDERTAE